MPIRGTIKALIALLALVAFAVLLSNPIPQRVPSTTNKAIRLGDPSLFFRLDAGALYHGGYYRSCICESRYFVQSFEELLRRPDLLPRGATVFYSAPPPDLRGFVGSGRLSPSELSEFKRFCRLRGIAVIVEK